MSYDSSQQVGEIGVSIASVAIQKLGWIFREQNKADHGIDAHVEIVNDQYPTGKLIGLQIKSGPSYFKEFDDDEFVVRGKGEKLEYWSNHCLPVVILLVDIETENIYWQVVDNTKIYRTKAGWKMGIPRNNRLMESSRAILEEIAEGSPSDRRLWRLRLDLELMRFLQQDTYNQLFVEAVTWLNKSLPRTEMKLLSRDADGEEELIQDFGFRFGWRLETLLDHLFPWADASIDEDHYEFFENEDTPRGYGEKWRPYEDNGETGSWRIELVLNDLGLSFVRIGDYLEQE